MPRRRDERARVLGPTWIPSKGRWRIKVIKTGDGEEDRDEATRWFVDEQLALDTFDEIEREIAKLNKVKLGEAIDQYREHLHEKGTGMVSYTETTRRLKLFFAPLEMAVSRVTEDRARAAYEAFRTRKRPDGEPISVDYHRAALINARSFLNWCVEREWLRANPLAGVKGVGRRNAGKPQHTGDETRRLYDYCLARAQAGDRGALGVLMALLMALRSSDITRRLVRDVDLDATVLRVSAGKTKKSNRPRKIPAVLQPALPALVAGRSPFDPLFATPYTKSRHHTRRWLEEAMVKLCAGAGVPYVCPHALKGTAATLLTEAGEAAEVIVSHLSHEKKSTTERHYVAPGAFEDAQTERALVVIAGGKR